MADDEAKKGSSNAPNGRTTPTWRYYFFALLILIVLLGGKALEIPREVSVPVLLGSLIALANGVIPTWFGKDR